MAVRGFRLQPPVRQSWSWLRPVLLAVALAVPAAACDLPQPFAHEGPPPPLAQLPTAAGVAVVPPDDVPADFAGEAVTALAEALRAADVPAQWMSEEEAATTGGYVVRALLTGDGPDQHLTWELRNPEGVPLALRRQSLAGAATDGPTGRRLGRAAGEALIAAIDADADAPLTRRMAAPAARPLPEAGRRPPIDTAPPPLGLVRVDGLPAEQGQFLGAAMRGALAGRGVDFAEDALLGLSGHVTLGAAKADGSHDIHLLWVVHQADGTPAGSAEQANSVPAALLADRFPALASAVAEAAAPGIVAILKRTIPQPLTD
jgi:hypothetical protein